MSKELIDNAKDLREIGEGIREPICFAAADELESLRAQLKEAQADAAHWKNNHETEVRRARILKERTDMPIERVDAYEQWGKDQMALKEAQAEIERITDSNNLYLDRIEYLESKLRCHSSYAKRPILYTDGVNGEQCCRDDLWAVSTEELNAINEQLAASQAREVQLREALDAALAKTHRGSLWLDIEEVDQLRKALALPSDTTAIEAMIQKAGEVMRERCADACTETYRPFYWDKHGGSEEWPVNNSPEDCSKAIRALPGVTLEDLK